MNHLKFIVKDGTVKIPSIFMFKDILVLKSFLDNAKRANCTIVFENESLELPPHWENTDARYSYYIYSSMVTNKRIGESYVRYLDNLDEMTWDNVK